MAVNDSEWQRLKEMVEILAGVRGDKRMSALRAGTFDTNDVLAKLRKITQQNEKLVKAVKEIQFSPPGKGAISAPPTADDFNALVADILALHEQISSLANAITK